MDAWLRSPDFVPPTVEELNLFNCHLPDDPGALDFPGVHVAVH